MKKPTSDMPDIGMGTFRLEGSVAQESVEMALSEGYRHIDTAQIYGNELEVGTAVKHSGISRSELFITTKVWNSSLSSTALIASVEDSLNKLQSDYVDLLLVHWPAPEQAVPMAEYLSELQKAREAGLTRRIGVSNFTTANLLEAFETIPAKDIYTNQIEVHPYLSNDRVRGFCHEQGIMVTGYMPFAVGKALKEEAVLDIARQHQVNAAQVLVAWQLAKGIKTIPSSTKRENLRINLQGVELKLSEADIARIDQLNCNERIANPEFSPSWD